MNCKICGIEVSKDSAFCPSCGSKLEQEGNIGSSVDQFKSTQQNQSWQNQQNQNWGNQGGDSYYQQPTQQFQQKYNYRMAKKMSDPAELYEPPNSKLNGVIVILWIQMVLTLISIPLLFFLWYALDTQLPPELAQQFAISPSEFKNVLLIAIGITIVLTAISFWQAKMVRRYHNGAKILAIIQNIPGLFTLMGGNLLGILNLVVVYVLGFDKETKMQFARYN